ncbi:MAG: hypothetical protein YYHSYBAR_003208 [Candidatus Fervidibacter sacchari]
MRVLATIAIWSAVLMSPLVCNADSAILVKEGLWRLIAEENQIAVIKIDEKGFVDVSLFISIVDKSGKSNIVHLVLPFRDKPLSLRAEELVLAGFRRQHVEALEERVREIQFARLKAIRTIDDGFRLTLVLGFPVGLFLWRQDLASSIRATPPGIRLGSVQHLVPELVVTTEHTRTEVYRIEQPSDVEELLRKTEVSKEQLERLKRQLVGRYLYLVTVKTVPLQIKSQSPSARSQRQIAAVPESERLGVAFHVRLKASRNSEALTFTYPLGTGETWGNPISLTEIFVVAPSKGSLQLRFPQVNLPAGVTNPNPHLRNWQRTFLGRDEFGHIARISYTNANPSEDVVAIFDPKKASTVPAKETAEKIGRFGRLPFLALFLLLWLPAVRLFQIYTTERPKPFGSFIWEAIGVGFLWALVNGSMSLFWMGSIELDYFEWLSYPTQTKLIAVFLFVLVFALLITLAFMPSLRPLRVKLLLAAFGLLIVFIAASIDLAPLVALLAILAALPLSSLVIYFWLNREGERSPTYWHCLTFSLLFGFSVTMLSLLLRETLLAVVGV